ncbi:hypothetical protein QQX98_006180 [Neonectria punicea]|uniref:Uncharacterized protein n=1 Tax=Neonectria punicea TaxID=979145 RepID=A0ABR1H250_9HYPO
MTRDLHEGSLNVGTDENDASSLVDMTWMTPVAYADDGEWNIIQKLMYFDPGLVSSMDPRTQESSIRAAQSLSNPDNLALINCSVPDGLRNFYFSANQGLNKLVITLRGEWIGFTIPIIKGWHVSVSLCYDSFTSVDANVTVSVNVAAPESDLTAWNVTSRVFGTEIVREQMGVLEKREAAKLSQSLNFVRQDIKSLYSFGMFMCGICGLQFQSSNTTRISYQYSNQLQVQIFQDVLRTTGNSALAWQTHFTLIGRMAYYNMPAYFDVGDYTMIS